MNFKRPCNADAAPSKKKAPHEVDGEIFVPVWDPLKCCCLCGQYNEDVQLGLTERDQEEEEEEQDVALLVCHICYHSVHKYFPSMTVQEVLEHSLSCGHVPGGLNKFFKGFHAGP